jgi:DNA-3-methyladenine glycosylase II
MTSSLIDLPYAVHLSRDRKMSSLIRSQGPVQLIKRRKQHLHSYLCASIISQQLSTKVASVIHQRFLGLFGGIEPEPRQILDTDDVLLRSIGLSAAKTGYIKSVARFELDQGMGLKKIGKWSDEEIIEYLTQIRGVGRWTVEMLLIFALGREDVFAADDLGIRNAMIGLYRIKSDDPKAIRSSLLRISETWRPYRSYACLHLWRWKDGQ